MHTCSCEQNWKTCGLSYLGTSRTVPQGVLFNWKEFEETLLTQWRGSLSRMEYYATKGSNGEDEIDTEGGI